MVGGPTTPYYLTLMAITLGTLIQRIKEELPRHASADDDRITLAILSTLEYYKHKQLGFNEGTATFTTTVDQESYGNESEEGAGAGYPNDLLAPGVVFLEHAGGTWVDLPQRNIDYIRQENYTDVYQGYADYYAWFEEKIYLTPVPHVTYDIRLDYIKDLGSPFAVYESNAWVFKEDITEDPIDNTYENDWFDKAEELIRLHAKIDLNENVFKNLREADRLRGRESEVYRNLKGQYNIKKMNSPRIPYY